MSRQTTPEDKEDNLVSGLPEALPQSRRRLDDHALFGHRSRSHRRDSPASSGIEVVYTKNNGIFDHLRFYNPAFARKWLLMLHREGAVIHKIKVS